MFYANKLFWNTRYFGQYVAGQSVGEDTFLSWGKNSIW